MRKLFQLLIVLGASVVRPQHVDARASASTCTQSMTAKEQAFVRGAQRAFEKARVPQFVRHAFVANAFRESRYHVAKSTPPTAPDARAGGSHTAYQILKPNLVKALHKLGLQWSDAIPAHPNPTIAEIEHYAEVQTRVALEVADAMGIRWSLSEPQEPQVLNFFSRWAAGSWSWKRVLGHPTVSTVLADGIPADSARLRRAAELLEAQTRLISASALYKLLIYRQQLVGCMLDG